MNPCNPRLPPRLLRINLLISSSALSRLILAFKLFFANSNKSSLLAFIIFSKEVDNSSNLK